MDSTNHPGGNPDPERHGYPSHDDGDDAMTRRMDMPASEASEAPNPPAYSPPPAYIPPQYGAPQQYSPPQPPIPPPQFVQPGYQPTPGNYAAYPTAKDPNTAVAIEIVAGLFGFLGIGYIFSGRTQEGIILLIGWWVAIALAFFIVLPIIGVVTLGFGFCLYCFTPLVWLGGPIISGLRLRNLLTGQPMPFINR